MSTFIDTDHPRAGDGKFTDKPHSAPEVSLNQPHPEALAEAIDPELLREQAQFWADRAAAERRFEAGVAHPEGIYFDAIWRGSMSSGYSEKDARVELEALRKEAQRLISAGMDEQLRYVQLRIAEFERALEVRGRNLPENISAVHRLVSSIR